MNLKKTSGRIFYCCLVAKLCLTLLSPHGLWPTRLLFPWYFQATIWKWVAICFSGRSSQPRDQNHISCIYCIGRPILYHWAPREPKSPVQLPNDEWRGAKDFSVQFSRSVMSNSLRPHELQHARPPCPSPTPGVHPDPFPLSRWCYPAILSSVVPFTSCPQSFPASRSFSMSQLFT